MVKPRIAIVGLGLIGGSLARRLANAGCEVIAWNHNDRPYATAEADGIICKPTLAALAEANPDVLVLCNPLKAMPQILGALKPLINPETTTLTDVGSVKGMVRDQVKAVGLDGCYVGAHPMAGNELSGWEASDPQLYDGALWAITVDENTEYRRFLTVADMIVNRCGNRLIVLDDATHDRCAALISHMPHVVATAMINELVANPNRNIAAALAAGSWRDMTRVALTDPNRTRAMVEEDAANVETLLRDMANRLTLMANVLHDMADANVRPTEGDVRQMDRFFAQGQPFRDYKAAVKQPDYTERCEKIKLAIPEDDWRRTLLESARRGEHIVRFEGEHDVIVEVRSAV
ncbi:prephenate dehydrogenase [Bifidobacterium ruminantium]|uniref:prephenate dehydrogenase n=1 Tax=Bifidobacterium ruminantium TaxID=78346 RepID=UPI003CC8784C